MNIIAFLFINDIMYTESENERKKHVWLKRKSKK